MTNKTFDHQCRNSIRIWLFYLILWHDRRLFVASHSILRASKLYLVVLCFDLCVVRDVVFLSVSGVLRLAIFRLRDSIAWANKCPYFSLQTHCSLRCLPFKDEASKHRLFICKLLIARALCEISQECETSYAFGGGLFGKCHAWIVLLTVYCRHADCPRDWRRL